MTKLRVAAVHACPPLFDRHRALEVAEGFIDEAAGQGARLVCFPEAFLPGFPHWLNAYAPSEVSALYRRYWEQAVELDADSAVVATLCQIAARCGVVVIMGATVRDGNSLYNALLAIDTDGRFLGHRRKLVPTASERQLWGFGPHDDLEAWDTAVGGVTGMMCWEHALSLPRELLARTGAALHVSAWPGLSSLPGYQGLFHEQVNALIRSHALATQSFVVSAMSPLPAAAVERIARFAGRDSDLLRPGEAWSAVVHPSGALLAERSGADNGLLITDIDIGAVVDAARVLDVAGHSARDDLFTLVRHGRAPAPG